MRIFRLAKLYERKYGLISEAASVEDIMRDVVENIKAAFRNYIDPKTAKSKAYNAIPVFATREEPHTQKIMGHMYDLVAQIDTLKSHPSLLFAKVNRILAYVKSLDETIKETRTKSPEFLPSQQVLNAYRNDLKRLEESLKRFSSLMVKSAKVLQKLLPEEKALEGGVVQPARLPLTKEKLLMFMRSPAAQKYGFDSLDMMRELLAYPETKEKLTTLINAVDRGHIPIDGPAIMAEVAAIKQWLDTKKTNLPALEKKPSFVSRAPALFEEEEEKEEEGK